MLEIFVDGDACPVKEEVYRVAVRYGLPVHVVANGWMRVPDIPLVRLVLVTEGLDRADDWITEHTGIGDIVITADVPLAERCVKAGARVLAPNGREFTPSSIGSDLATRNLLTSLREAGEIRGGGRPFSKQDRSQFLVSLDRAVHAIRQRGRCEIAAIARRSDTAHVLGRACRRRGGRIGGYASDTDLGCGFRARIREADPGRRMMEQNAAHRIVIEPKPGRVRVHLGDHVIADSAQVLVLREGSLAPVFYLPREDAAMELFERSTHHSHCPFKGDAAYYTVAVGGRRAENAAWSYETPFSDVAAIAGHLAFYPDKVRIEDVH